MVFFIPGQVNVLLRLRDAPMQHMNDKLRDAQAKVGEERVSLQLLSPTGKDVDTALEQLSILEVSRSFQSIE